MVREKLAIPGNEPVNVSSERKQSLQRQLDTELKPVLRDKDFRKFDLERATQAVKLMAKRLNEATGFRAIKPFCIAPY